MNVAELTGIDVPTGTTDGNMTLAQMQRYAAFLPPQLYFPSAQWVALGSDIVKDAQVRAAHPDDLDYVHAVLTDGATKAHRDARQQDGAMADPDVMADMDAMPAPDHFLNQINRLRRSAA